LCGARSSLVRTHNGAVDLRLVCNIREAIAEVGIHSWRDLFLPKHFVEGRLLRDSPRVLIIVMSEEEEELQRLRPPRWLFAASRLVRRWTRYVCRWICGRRHSD